MIIDLQKVASINVSQIDNRYPIRTPVYILDTLKFLERLLIGERHHAPITSWINGDNDQLETYRGFCINRCEFPWNDRWVMASPFQLRHRSSAVCPIGRDYAMRSMVNGFLRLALKEYTVMIWRVGFSNGNIIFFIFISSVNTVIKYFNRVEQVY